jgi:uncharacterized membrane protein
VNPTAPAPGLAPGGKPRGRLDAIDWLRGLAVVLMIQTHLYDSWCNAAAKTTEAYAWSRFIGGIPSRLFLLLVGVSMAIRYESQLARQVDRRTMVRVGALRGLEIVGLAYLFRIQEWILGGRYDWHDIFRVDILNCIGASMVVTAFIAAPRRGRPQILVCLVAAAIALALGPIIGPHHFPDWPPRQLTSYLGGERPLAWFPLFPWLAWPLCGVALGHYWVRASATPRRQAMAFVLTGAVGLAMTYAVIAVRRFAPHLIHYPSDLVQQMGPGTFFYRLGTIGPMALAGYLVTRFLGTRYSALCQLGKTSLLVYWVHVELVYGLLFGRLHHKLGMAEASVGLVLMTAAMLGLSVLRTKYWRGLRWRRKRGNLPSAVSGL